MAAKRTKAQAEAKIAEAYRDLWQTPQGRVVLGDLLMSCHVFEPSFAPDALSTAFREGERNIGLRIARYLDMQPQAFAQAYGEAYDALTNVYYQQN